MNHRPAAPVRRETQSEAIARRRDQLPSYNVMKLLMKYRLDAIQQRSGLVSSTKRPKRFKHITGPQTKGWDSLSPKKYLKRCHNEAKDVAFGSKYGR